MESNKNIDIRCDYVLNKIDFNILKSLSPEHLAAIEDAINSCQLREKHVFDIRGKINLFFIRYYFVFLIGRDRRAFVEELEAERRAKVSLLTNLVYFMIFFFGIVLSGIFFMVIGLYTIKTFIGIDLFPSEHMGRFLGL